MDVESIADARLTSATNYTDSQISAVSEDITTLENTISVMQTSITDLGNEAITTFDVESIADARLTSATNYTDSQITAVSSDVTTLENNVSALQTAVDDLGNETLTTVEVQSIADAALSSAVDYTNTQLSSTASDITTLTNTLTGLQMTVDDLQIIASSVDSVITLTEVQAIADARLTGAINYTDGELVTVNEDISTLSTDISNLNLKVEGLPTFADVNSAASSTLTNSTTYTDNLIGIINNDITTLTSDLSGIQATVGSLPTVIEVESIADARLTNATIYTDSQIGIVNNNITALETSINVLPTTSEVNSIANNALTQSTYYTDDQLVTVSEAIATLQSDLNDVQAEVDTLPTTVNVETIADNRLGQAQLYTDNQVSLEATERSNLEVRVTGIETELPAFLKEDDLPPYITPTELQTTADQTLNASQLYVDNVVFLEAQNRTTLENYVNNLPTMTDLNNLGVVPYATIQNIADQTLSSSQYYTDNQVSLETTERSNLEVRVTGIETELPAFLKEDDLPPYITPTELQTTADQTLNASQLYVDNVVFLEAQNRTTLENYVNNLPTMTDLNNLGVVPYATIQNIADYTLSSSQYYTDQKVGLESIQRTTLASTLSTVSDDLNALSNTLSTVSNDLDALELAVGALPNTIEVESIANEALTSSTQYTDDKIEAEAAKRVELKATLKGDIESQAETRYINPGVRFFEEGLSDYVFYGDASVATFYDTSNGKKDLRFVVPGEVYNGLRFSSNSSDWVGSINSDHYKVVIEYTLHSGNRESGGLLCDWVNTSSTQFREQVSWADIPTITKKNGRSRATFTFTKPSNFSGTFYRNDIYILPSSGIFGIATTDIDITIHEFSVIEVEPQEVGEGSWAPALSAAVTDAFDASVVYTNDKVAAEATLRTHLESSINTELWNRRDTTECIADRFFQKPTKWYEWQGSPVYDQNGLTFNTPDTSNQGIYVHSYNNSRWIGVENEEAYVVVVEYSLLSGGLGGAGILFDWRNTDNQTFRTQKALSNDFDVTKVANTTNRYRAVAICKRPEAWYGTFQQNVVYVIGSYAGLGLIQPKHIIFHEISIKPAKNADKDIGPLKATVDVQGSTLATLQGDLTAKYGIKVQSGNRLAFIDLLSNNVLGSKLKIGGDVVKIEADSITLSGDTNVEGTFSLNGVQLFDESIDTLKLIQHSISESLVVASAIDYGAFNSDWTTVKSYTFPPGFTLFSRVVGEWKTAVYNYDRGGVRIQVGNTTIASYTLPDDDFDDYKIFKRQESLSRGFFSNSPITLKFQCYKKYNAGAGRELILNWHKIEAITFKR